MPAQHEHALFEPPIGRWALIGAVLGLVALSGGFLVLAIVQDLDRTVIGAGFGAMLGAVLGAIKAAETEAD